MTFNSEKAKMLAGELYRSADPELVADAKRAQRLVAVQCNLRQGN